MITTAALSVVSICALAYAQATPESQTPPKTVVVSANPYAWALDLGVPGLLLAGLVGVWRLYVSEAKDHKDSKTGFEAEKATLKKLHDEGSAKVWEEARRDKNELRAVFEAERAAYVVKLDAMQAKLEREQVDRREEAERLLREQTTLTKEVMVTAQGMSVSLQKNAEVIDRLDDTIRKSG